MRGLGRIGIVALGLVMATGGPPRAIAAGTEAPAIASVVQLGPGSQLWLVGTSTLHDFECRSQKVALELGLAANAARPANAEALFALVRASSVLGVQVKVPVVSLHSEKEGLDKNLRKAMKVERFPNVHFRLGSYTCGAAPANGDSVAIHAQGTLTIVGQERPAVLEATARRSRDGVWLDGSYSLRMSEFGITPPTMMLGTIRTGDRVTIHYHLLLVPKADAAAQPPVIR
jgi:polyisoprenoid-binding protein YceI